MLRVALLVPALLAVLVSASVPARAEGWSLAERDCAAMGPGFAPVPGTQTCLKLGGRVRADAVAGTAGSRAAGATRLEHGARIRLDARTRTEYGPLRVVIDAGVGGR